MVGESQPCLRREQRASVSRKCLEGKRAEPNTVFEHNRKKIKHVETCYMHVLTLLLIMVTNSDKSSFPEREAVVNERSV